MQMDAVGKCWVKNKVNYCKKKVNKHEVFENEVYVRYATFLYKCGTKFHANWTIHRTNLRMMEGPFYDEDTMHDMELHLMSHITNLTKLLKKENLNEYLKYEHQVRKMIKEMKVPRTSAHSTKERSVPSCSEHMRNRKRVVAGGA